MKTLLLLLLNPFICNNLFSQIESYSTQSVEDTEDQIVFEKVYLHTDRSNYFSGESIWFKAYLVNASTNMLIDYSKNLYVELISADSEILQKRLIQIEDGVGIGDFQTSDSIKSGCYIIRAYTSWMRNFGDNFFFEKTIDIANPNNQDFLIQKNDPAIKSGVDIQFFPEGGSLVDSVPTKLAFKAMDSTGIGCKVKGSIRSRSGQVISAFESSHLGMGVIPITPFTNETYTISGLAEDGQEFFAKMPEIFKTGITLEVKGQNTTEIYLSIKVNRTTLKLFPNKIFKLKISSHNEEYMDYDIKISSLANRFTVTTTDLPEGISRLTLSNNEGQPQCERLVYINKKQEYKISISSNNTIYSPRSEVKLNIIVKDTLGALEPASISLSAVDSSILSSSKLASSDITSYLLLESELKGHIEQPNYYFDSKNEDRYKKLDLLLLTQGWRDFIWKYIPSNIIKPQFPLETSIAISGKLKRVVFDKPIDKANVTLTLFDDSLRYYAFTRTDSLGCFRFDSLYFSGSKKIILSAKADNKMLQELITIDSVDYNAPDLDYKPLLNINDFLSMETQLNNDPLYHKMRKKKYTLSDTIVLDELIIKKYIRKNQFQDKHVRIYNAVDQIVKVNEKDAGFSDIFSLIRGKVPNVRVYNDYATGSYFVKIGGPRQLSDTVDISPLFLLNGVPTTVEFLLNVPVYTVDKIEVMKRNASIFGCAAYNGVISVHTKNGLNGTYSSVTSSIKKRIVGYNAPRIFYAPKYNTPTSETEKADLRTTIYWEPNIITTDKEGETINFFNADKLTTVIVRAEGITQSGKPVTGFLKYVVKKKI